MFAQRLLANAINIVLFCFLKLNLHCTNSRIRTTKYIVLLYACKRTRGTNRLTADKVGLIKTEHFIYFFTIITGRAHLQR